MLTPVDPPHARSPGPPHVTVWTPQVTVWTPLPLRLRGPMAHAAEQNLSTLQQASVTKDRQSRTAAGRLRMLRYAQERVLPRPEDSLEQRGERF